MTELTVNIAPSGDPDRVTICELLQLAASAKTKIKTSARGWSLLSQREVIAMAWLTDMLLEDAFINAPAPATPEPTVISNV